MKIKKMKPPARFLKGCHIAKTHASDIELSNQSSKNLWFVLRSSRIYSLKNFKWLIVYISPNLEKTALNRNQFMIDIGYKKMPVFFDWEETFFEAPWAKMLLDSLSPRIFRAN